METKRKKKRDWRKVFSFLFVDKGLRLAQSFDSKSVRDEKDNLSCDEPRF